MLATFLKGAALAAPNQAQLEFVGEVSSTSNTINIASLTGNGRLCVLADNTYVFSTTIPAAVTPAGFTQLRTLGFSGATSLRLTTSLKILNGTEGSLTGQAVNIQTLKRALVFRFTSGNISSFNWQPIVINAQIVGSGSLTQQSLGGGQVAPFINIGVYGSNSNRNTTGLAPLDATFPGTATQCRVDYDIVNSGTQSATMSAGPSALQAMMSFTLNVS
jgi:hypothetical protein